MLAPFSVRLHDLCGGDIDRLFLVLVKRPPSEQLVDPEGWHTTALILTETGAHFELATRLLECTNNVPKKWSKSSLRHKESFESVLATGLDGVHIRAISAQGKMIETSFEHMISELGLAGVARPTVKNNKPYVEFGPFIKTKFVANPDGTLKEDTEPATFSLARNQAIPLVFICHFLLRTHQSLLKLVQTERSDLQWMDWQLMPNRFPGDIGDLWDRSFMPLCPGHPISEWWPEISEFSPLWRTVQTLEAS